MKVAITSSDGKKVDLHFGKTSGFYIYNIEEEKMVFEGIRTVPPYCMNDSGESEENHEYRPDKISIIYDMLKDCKKLYTMQIGDKPLEGLTIKGLNVQICNCDIDMLSGCDCNCKN